MCTNRCAQKIHVRNGKAIAIEMLDSSAKEFCPRWKAQLDFIYHKDRLAYPLKRTGARGDKSFIRISWDEALDTTADKLQKIRTDYGPESAVFYIAYTKEPRPYLHRLAHAFGSPNYCTESSSCFSANWLACVLNYGQDYGYLAVNSWIIEPETKCKVVWGSSVRNSTPQFWQQHVEAKKNGVRFIVVDPVINDIASLADIHLQLRPGTDGALALGMIHIIIYENLYDREFVDKWTTGFSKFKEIVQGYTPEKVQEITGVPKEKIVEAARLYAVTRPAKVALSPQSSTHHSNGVQAHRAISLLPALTGNLDTPGGNMHPAEAISPKITLHEKIDRMPPGVGSEQFPIWTKLYREMKSNILAERIASPAPYPIKGLFASGLNPMFFPNSARFIEMAKKLDFIAVADYFQTPGTQLADIVFPVASWLERPIFTTFNNGKMMFIDPAIEPVGESWHEFKIYAELAKRLGLGAEFWDGHFEHCINHCLEPYSITVDDLRKCPEGYIYPLADQEPKSYEKTGFKTPSGKVEIYSDILAQHGHDPYPVYCEPAESPMSTPTLAADYPLILSTGARSIHYTHSCFRNIERLRKEMPEPLLEIHPEDAISRNIRSGDKVVISTPRGKAQMAALVTNKVLPGVVHAPHHWEGNSNINLVISDRDLDPISGFAAFKSQLCQIQKK